MKVISFYSILMGNFPYGNKMLIRAKIIQRKKAMRGSKAPIYNRPIMINNPKGSRRER
jgi:hypothetical protein